MREFRHCRPCFVSYSDCFAIKSVTLCSRSDYGVFKILIRRESIDYNDILPVAVLVLSR